MTLFARAISYAVAVTILQTAWVAAASAESILFIGNSFTFGAASPVQKYRASSVTDINKSGIGGVPALFKTFTEQTGLDYQVSLETEGGKGLDFHLKQRRDLISGRWDVVVLQDYSTLDIRNPGNAAAQVDNVRAISPFLRSQHAKVRLLLEATWSRADQTYLMSGHWYGRPIEAMADDLRAAADLSIHASPQVSAVIPVGQAWNRAFAKNIADANPYDGLDFGKVDLWTYDQYHASMYGYYLAALVIFGEVTGRDPRVLGEKEIAAAELGIAPRLAVRFQETAFEQLEAEKHRPRAIGTSR